MAQSEPLLTVTEIFASIQGETSFCCLPCTFVRLTGCNLRCGYCDTTYAYDSGQTISPDEIISRVAELGLGRVCITGGEPMLQKETPALVRKLLDRGFLTLVETNGTVPISDLDPWTIRIMDVKCPSSGEHEKMLWENFRHLADHDEVKFVISTRQDYEYAKEVLSKYRKKARWKALFSPAFGTLAPELPAQWILEDKLDVRLQLQIHKIIWGPQRRGV